MVSEEGKQALLDNVELKAKVDRLSETIHKYEIRIENYKEQLKKYGESTEFG